MVMDLSKWWWIGNHNTTNFSPWLRSTLSELDAKTKEMLRVIDEEADSFAERAEMYYKKRPELISMVEDFYRSHRSLAERYDLLKPSKHGGIKSFERSSTITATNSDDSSSAWSDDSEIEEEEEYGESEVDDGESKDDIVDEEINPNWEIEKLREEIRVYREVVEEKDEEKREVIRQMSLAIQMLKEENLELKKCVVDVVLKQKEGIWKVFEFKKVNLDGLLGRVSNWVLF